MAAQQWGYQTGASVKQHFCFVDNAVQSCTAIVKHYHAVHDQGPSCRSAGTGLHYSTCPSYAGIVANDLFTMYSPCALNTIAAVQTLALQLTC
jgi:hypothetical protein